MSRCCWHRWSAWKDVSTIGRIDIVQERRCQRCGLAKRRRTLVLLLDDDDYSESSLP